MHPSPNPNPNQAADALAKTNNNPMWVEKTTPFATLNPCLKNETPCLQAELEARLREEKEARIAEVSSPSPSPFTLHPNPNPNPNPNSNPNPNPPGAQDERDSGGSEPSPEA